MQRNEIRRTIVGLYFVQKGAISLESPWIGSEPIIGVVRLLIYTTRQLPIPDA
ncbi:MAG: hypothetical protein ND866_03485 [Pyrinomonadaceae bacterium]|nr:hypothetical protein [Pyrinomonadaceae bacterium]